MKQVKSTWRNRIVGYSEEEPDQLLANPSNWRIHPAAQQNALSGVLKEIGLVQNVVANRTTGHLVDGHLRVMLAMRENQPTVPVTWVELSEEEEHLILASLDPLAAMATADAGALDALLSSVQSGEEAVTAMLAELAEDAGLYAPKDEDGNTAILPDVIYSQDEIIEAAFTWFRANGFPYRNLAPHVSMQQINKLLQTEPENLINTDMAYHVADTYHPHRFHAAADSMDGLTSELAPFDWHAQVQTKLEQQLGQHVLLAAAGDDVLDVVEQVAFQIATGLPGAEVGLVEFVDAEAGVTGKQRIVGLGLGAGAAKAFFSQLGNVPLKAELVAHRCSCLLALFGRIERLRQLNRQDTPRMTVNRVLLHHGLSSRSRACKQIRNNVIVTRSKQNASTQKIYRFWEIE